MSDELPRWQHASLWATALATDRSAPRDAASTDRAEVVVVGAGIAGLVTAMVLHRAGMQVLVVERHRIGGVTTRGSTGKLTALQGDLIARVAKRRGADAAGA